MCRQARPKGEDAQVGSPVVGEDAQAGKSKGRGIYRLIEYKEITPLINAKKLGF
jgi:hypothetical protein